MPLTWFADGSLEPYRFLPVPPAQAEVIERMRVLAQSPPSVTERNGLPPVHAVVRAKAASDEKNAPPSREFEQEFERVKQRYQSDSTPGERVPAVFVNQIMKSPVITVRAKDSVQTALDLLRSNRIRHLPVVDDRGSLAGIISDRDLLRHGSSGTIARIMSGSLLTCRVDTLIREAAHVLVLERINCLPVIDPLNRVVGIVTTTDILHCLVHRAPLDLWV